MLLRVCKIVLGLRMPPHLPRMIYVAGFLLAVIAISVLWSQVGGQGHLELMPWYWKLVLIGGLGLATVRASVSAAMHERAWNNGTLVWVLVAILLMGAMAAATYYAHTNEDEEDSEDGQGVAIHQVMLGGAGEKA